MLYAALSLRDNLRQILNAEQIDAAKFDKLSIKEYRRCYALFDRSIMKRPSFHIT